MTVFIGANRAEFLILAQAERELPPAVLSDGCAAIVVPNCTNVHAGVGS